MPDSAQRRTTSALVATVIGVVCAAVPASSPAAAPDPGGDEHAQISGAPPGKAYGFNDAFQLQGLGSDLFGDLTIAIGGNAARMPMSWWELEPVRDVLNEVPLAAYALNYELFLARGIRPHFVITGTPPWAREQAFRGCTDLQWCFYPPAPAMLGEWREFIAELARRFPQATLEIWNEPNYKGSWRSGVDPGRYAALLAAADEAAASVDPGIRVIMGGLGSSAKPESLSPREFLSGAYSATPTLKGHTEALNLHIYPGPELGQNSFLAHIFAGIRGVRSAHGDDTTAIYVSEVGATTSGPHPANEDEQADIVMRATRRLLTMPDVSGVLVSRLSEDPVALAADTEQGLGVMRRTLLGLEPKLAFCALTRATGSMDQRCPPETRIDSHPPKLSNSPTASLKFSSFDPVAGFQCSLDDGPFKTCSSPGNYTELADGRHAVAVRAMDVNGRVDPFPARSTFGVDTAPPETSMTGLTGDTRHTRPVYGLTADEQGATFECSLNAAPFEPCDDPFRPGTLAEGNHEVQARAIDPAGNVDPTPAIANLRVDLTAPETTLTREPQRWEPDRSPVVRFASNESGVSFRCALDSWDFKPCENGSRLGPLDDGDHAFRVMALDPALNGDASPAYANFTVDTVAPTIQITRGPQGPTREQRPIFSIVVNEPGARTQCAFDSQGYRACTGWRYHQSEANLGEGEHTLRARAIDLAGNMSTVARRTFTVDRTAPPAPRVSSAPGWVPGGATTGDPWFRIQAHEADSTILCRLDTARFAPCSERQQYSDLAAGRHLFHALAVDAAGNLSAPTTVGFTVDRTIPETSILHGPSRTKRRRPRFVFEASEAGVGFECAVRRRHFQGRWRLRRCDNPHRTRRLKPRRYVLRVRAIDAAGNVDPMGAKTRFRVMRRR